MLVILRILKWQQLGHAFQAASLIKFDHWQSHFGFNPHACFNGHWTESTCSFLSADDWKKVVNGGLEW